MHSGNRLPVSGMYSKPCTSVPSLTRPLTVPLPVVIILSLRYFSLSLSQSFSMYGLFCLYIVVSLSLNFSLFIASICFSVLLNLFRTGSLNLSPSPCDYLIYLSSPLIPSLFLTLSLSLKFPL